MKRSRFSARELGATVLSPMMIRMSSGKGPPVTVTSSPGAALEGASESI